MVAPLLSLNEGDMSGSDHNVESRGHQSRKLWTMTYCKTRMVSWHESSIIYFIECKRDLESHIIPDMDVQRMQ
jgi:hypothetical protein